MIQKHSETDIGEPRSVPYVVIGAGLAGLATAIKLRKASVVLEKAHQPGGLVVGRKIGEYWFDLVPHMLYFPDPATEQFIRPVIGSVLKPVVPDGWVETARGVTRYPLQANLRGLDVDTVTACIRDLAKVTFGAEGEPARNMAESLRNTFGDAMCELFMYPYNRKVWARDLVEMPPTLMWSFVRPSFEAVLRGAIVDETYPTYNSNGWYPLPGPGAPRMTMALLSDALAERAGNVELGSEVVAVDLNRRLVETRTERGRELHRYESGLIVTIPMPQFARICKPIPDTIQLAVQSLQSMAVWMVALCIVGKRPPARGKWRYYSDESLCFTRLIHMHEYDPDTCPAGGWSIMAEILERSDARPRDVAALIETVERDVRRVHGLPNDCRVIEAHAWRCNPAYVIESEEIERVKNKFMTFLAPYDVHLVGRYGRWQYASMGQALCEGMLVGDALSP